jgi:hypothetical protein
MTHDKLQKANAATLSIAYGVFYDKERLELGKSTQNIDYAELHKSSESIQARIAELQAQEIALSQAADGVYEAKDDESTVTKKGNV